MRYLLSILLLVTFENMMAITSAQEDPSEIYHNVVTKPTIKTVKLHPKGWELAYPVIELNGNNLLELSFDELGEDIQDYSYRLIHCNSDWKISDLNEFDFLEGFTQNPINDYELSFNTNLKYVHYQVTIPNNDIQLKLSGNYIIQVFQDYDPENIILSRRFMIVEPLVNIKGEVKYPINLDIRDSHQEVDFTISHDQFPIDNPLLNLTVILTQNNRWDATSRKLKPLFIRPHQLVFDYDNENIFPGGNENRHFDIKSLRFQSHNIKSIKKKGDLCYVELFPDDNRHFKPYIYDPDLNGKSYIKVQERDDASIEADYAWVKFTLPWAAPMLNGNFYVFGQLSQWECSPQNVMKYNLKNRSYELELLLKQGYYNYQYAFLESAQEPPDLTLTEGSHKETENDYIIYVYYHDLAMNYDRMIGWQIINSIKRIH